MTELIRQDTEYAMRVLVYLVINNQKQMAVKDIAGSRNLPEDFLSKILRKLTQAGLTRCYKGYHGGFKLARNPDEITLWSVIKAIQGPIAIKNCCLDEESCPRESICEFLPELIKLQNNLISSLDSITLADVMKQESDT